jgi:hypothetical protein
MELVNVHGLVQGVRMSNATPRVLLVDDDPVLLQGLCDMLTYRLRPTIVGCARLIGQRGCEGTGRTV